jgi:hypothetical protein
MLQCYPGTKGGEISFYYKAEWLQLILDLIQPYHARSRNQRNKSLLPHSLSQIMDTVSTTSLVK